MTAPSPVIPSSATNQARNANAHTGIAVLTPPNGNIEIDQSASPTAGQIDLDGLEDNLTVVLGTNTPGAGAALGQPAQPLGSPFNPVADPAHLPATDALAADPGCELH